MSENEKLAQVPYFVHEGQMARMERIIRVLAALLVAALIIFVLNNIVWMRYVENQRGAYEEAITGLHEQPDSAAD